MFHHSIHPLTPHIPDIHSLQQTQTIRLQRLIQQRKRMDHLSLIIQQQKQTIDILQQQNSSINHQFCELKLQNQLLTDKLTVSSHNCEDLTEVLVKQISLIENIRGFLFGGFIINDYQKNMIDQEIQTSLSLYHTIQTGKASLHISNYSNQISQLAQENQLLNEKYQSLCADYLELNKSLKVKEYELLKLENNKLSQRMKNNQQNDENDTQQKDQNSTNHKKSKYTNSKQKKLTKNQMEDLLKIKELEIAQFKKIIQKLKKQLQCKNQLIKQHRKNEKEQKKLVDHLKVKFNEEGKQISQIAKFKHLIEVNPVSKSQLTYEIQKPIMKSSARRVQVPLNEVIETRVFQEKSVNLNQSKMNNSSHLKVYSKVQSLNEMMKEPSFKRTVSKCVIEN